MILVALTGGIGSGKSTVSQRLAARGAVIIDADAIVRELQRAGSPLLDRLAERFGAGVIRADGGLDRPALAAIAFTDDQALADLNAIVHPEVRAEIGRRIAAEAATDHVVVVDTPLFEVTSDVEFSAVIVVDVPPDVAVERLVGQRGLSETDARARIAKQIGREERIAKADRVIDNSGDLTALDAEVDELWEWLATSAVARGAGDAGIQVDSGRGDEPGSGALE
jgi:dephospho-CoA kinase